MIDEKGHERICLHVIIPEKQKKCPFTPPHPQFSDMRRKKLCAFFVSIKIEQKGVL